MSTMDTTTPDRQEKLARGEKLVVTAFMPALVVEGFLLPLALKMSFTWTAAIYGALTFATLIWPVGKLYDGRKEARVVAEGLALLQALVAFVCSILLAYTPYASALTSHVAQPVLWIAVLRLGAYVLMGLILLLARDVLDFMAARRGEETTRLEPLTATGVVVTLTEAQKANVGRLASALSNGGVVLLLAGVLLLAHAFTRMPIVRSRDLAETLPNLGPWLGQFLLPGFVALLMGVILLLTAPAARRVQDEGPDRAYVVALLNSLTSLFRWQMLLMALGIVAAVASLLVLLS